MEFGVEAVGGGVGGVVGSGRGEGDGGVREEVGDCDGEFGAEVEG